MSRGIDNGDLVLTHVLVFIGFGIIGIADGVDVLVAARQAFQFVQHLIFVVQVVNQAVFEGFVCIERGL